MSSKLILICVFCLGTVLSRVAAAQNAKNSGTPNTSVSDKFLGTWKLISIETIRPNGEIIYPFYGRQPEGLLMYDRSGWMSVQIVSDPKPAVPTADSREQFLAAAPAQKVKAIDGFYSY